MSKEHHPKTPHDLVFRDIMTDVEIAKDFLNNYLPPEILKHVDLSQMTIEKDTHINKKQKEQRLDILYQVKINDKKAYIYLLFEHKSYRDPKIILQLLQYMINTWHLELDQETKELPVILPLVVYHGRAKWNIGLKLSDMLIPTPPELKKYIPDYQYLLQDLPRQTSERPLGGIKLQAFIRLLVDIFHPEFAQEKLEAILKMLAEIEKESRLNITFVGIMITYIMRTQDDLTLEEVHRKYKQISEGSELVMTIAKQLERKGKAEGRSEGRIEGKIEGKIEIAQNMLKLNLDIATIQQVTGLSQKEIKQLSQ